MQDNPTRSRSNPPRRDKQAAALAQQNVSMRKQLNETQYELYQKDRESYFREIENAETFSRAENKMQAIDGDRSQLVKRVNALLVEIDRLNQEKENLYSQLQEQRFKCSDLEKRVKHSGKVKKVVSRNMQSDLKYEKDENARLRHLLHQLEVERAELRSRLKDSEAAVATYSYDKQDLSSKVQQKTDHISILESDNRVLVEKVNALQARATNAESANAKYEQEITLLRENLSYLEAQKAEAFQKVHEEGVRYENFQIAKNNEMENVKWIHKRHCRLLASRNICLELNKVTSRVLNNTLGFVKRSLQLEDCQLWGVEKVFCLFSKYSTRRTKTYLDRWRSVLNWRSTEASRTNFVQKFANRSMLSKYFSEWRCTHQDTIRVRQRFGYALSLLFKRYSKDTEHSLRGRFLQWKYVYSYDLDASTRMGKLSLRACMGKVRSALQKWNLFMKNMKNAQHREDLASEFAGTLLKVSFFKAFKELVAKKKYQRNLKSREEQAAEKLYQLSIMNELKRYTSHKNAKDSSVKRVVRTWVKKDLFAKFSVWKKETSDQKKMDRLYKYFGLVDQTHHQLTTHKLFYAWKNHLLSQKLKAASGELSNEKPLRMELEETLELTKQEHTRLSQIHSIRIFGKHCNSSLKSYFTQWKESLYYFHYYLPKVKHLLVKQYLSKVLSGFSRWKEELSQRELVGIARQNEEASRENEALTEHVNNLEAALEAREEERSEISSRKMRRVVLGILNKELTGGLRQWARNALKVTNLDEGSTKLETQLNKVFYSEGFSAILKSSFRNKLKTNMKNRLEYYFALKLKYLTSNVFQAWKDYRRLMSTCRKIIKKAQSRNSVYDLRRAVNTWKSQIYKISEMEFQIEADNLRDENNNLVRGLNKKSKEHEEEMKKNEQLSKKLSNKAKKRLVVALTQSMTKGRSCYFYRWKGYLEYKTAQSEETARLARVWAKLRERKAWRTWNAYIKKAYEVWSEEQISTHMTEKKELRRKIKGAKANHETTLKQKEGTISKMQQLIDKKVRIIEYFMRRTVKQQNEEYSINKAEFAFKALKKRYGGIKRYTKRFDKVFYLIKLRIGFHNIKDAASENFKIGTLRSMLESAFRNYSFRYLRNAFDSWLRNGFKKRELELNSVFNQESQSNYNFRVRQKAVRTRNCNKSLKILENKSKQKLFGEWAAVVWKKRAIKKASEKFQKSSTGIKQRWAIGQWFHYREHSMVKAHKMHTSETVYMRNAVSKMFKYWKQYHEVNFYLKGVFTSLQKRYTRDGLYFGLGRLSAFCAGKSKHVEWHSKSRSAALERILVHRAKKILDTHLRKWSEFSVEKGFSKEKVRNTMLRALYRKWRSAWQTWQETYLVIDTHEKTNKYGPVAQENEMLRSRVEIMNQLVEKEGLDPKYVENFILEREDLNSAIKRKKIARTMYSKGLVNSNDTNLVPRVFLVWKMWVVKRKKIQKSAKRMNAYRRQPNLMQAFGVWKKGFPLVQNSVSNLTRRQLYSLIAKMDRDIKTLEGRLETNHEDLELLKSYSTVLQTQTRRGQNQALILCKNNTEKSLFRAMLRWTVHTHLCKIQELLEQLTSIEEQYYYLKTQYREVEQEAKTLTEENMELRQASLDGIAIADAFETLTKEREKLNGDLADRAATIKRLLEENTQLSTKLKEFGHPHTTPERDYARTLRY